MKYLPKHPSTRRSPPTHRYGCVMDKFTTTIQEPDSVTDPSEISLADPPPLIFVRASYAHGTTNIVPSGHSRDGMSLWSVIQLVEIWQVPRRRVMAALDGEPIQYTDVWADRRINQRAWRKQARAFDLAPRAQKWPALRDILENRNIPKVRTLVVRGDVADRIYRDKIKPTLNVR